MSLLHDSDIPAIITRAAARVEKRRLALGVDAADWIPWERQAKLAEDLPPPVYPGSGLAARKCLECGLSFQSKSIGNRRCRVCKDRLAEMA